MLRLERTSDTDEIILAKHRQYYLFVTALFLAALAFDLRVELGVAGATLYMIVVAATYFGPRDRLPWEMAVACSIGTIVGYFESPIGGETWKIVTNRALSLIAIWVTTALVNRSRAAQNLLQAEAVALEDEVRERTAALSRSNVALERSKETMRQFAYNASNELKTPVRATRSFAELLEQRLGDRSDEESTRWIRYLLDNTERLHAMVEAMTDYARLDGRRRPFESTPMNEVFDDAAGALQSMIERTGGRVIRGDLPVVSGDAPQLRQLMRSLIENGLQHAGYAPPEIVVSAVRDDREWRFEVRDNGRGVDARHHKQIFEMFKRVHDADANPGTGIGLAISRKIAQRHGGRIWVESEPDVGSTFYFTIPARESSEGAPDETGVALSQETQGLHALQS